MSVLQNIWADLIEKKLWIVAVGLIALVVAAPMVLAKPGEAPSASVPPPPPAADQGPTLALTRSALTGFQRSPRVNDKRLDPFGNRIDKDLEKQLTKYLNASSAVIDSGSGSLDTGGGSGGGGVTPTYPSDDGGGNDDPGTDEPEVKTEKDDVLSILVSTPGAAEGSDAEAKEITDVRTLSPLPDTKNPFLVYVGKTSDGKATFLVSADAVHSGDGSCSPSPTDCRTLVMKVGDTANFTLANEGNKQVSITVTDLETKRVKVSGDDETTQAATAEAEVRATGATAFRKAVRDPDVLTSLVRRGVKIRH